MANYLVTVKYNPGEPKAYLVENKETAEQAKDHVVNLLMYHPGVPIEVIETPVNKNKPVVFNR